MQVVYLQVLLATVLETFAFLFHKLSDAKSDDGSTNYYADVLNSRSRYVWWAGHPSAWTDAGDTVGENNTFVVSGGTPELSLS